MSLPLLLSTLLGATGLVAAGAPPAPQDIDVDAMARAKDVQTAKPAAAEPAKPAAASAQDIDVDALARAKDAPAGQPSAGAPAVASPTASVPAAAAQAPAAATAATDSSANQASASAADGGPAPADATGGAATAANAATMPQPATAAAQPVSAKPPVNDEVKRLGATCDARATTLLDAARRGDFATATHDFDAKMRTAMTPEQFQKSWGELAQFGALIARGQSTIEKSDDYYAVGVPLMFEKADLFAQVTCGSDGRVAGFHVKPLAKSKTPPAAKP